MTAVPDRAIASRWARTALANVRTEFPTKQDHVIDGPGDAATSRALHPAFWGSFDWHSCVHMHWSLARLLRLLPDLPERDAIVAALDEDLAPDAIAGECAYLARPSARGFSRPYGWAWLLELAREVARADAPHAARWSSALAPLASAFEDRWLDWLPRAGYAVRHGMHPNSAFGLALSLDYARAAKRDELARAIEGAARDWFGADVDAPASWEPSGADFLSPALVEANLMLRVLPRADFAAWLGRFLPGLAERRPATLFAPASVSDRTDGQVVHLDGLNLSRAWCFEAIAAALPGDDPRVAPLLAAASSHRAAGLAGLASDDFMGEHWLVSFALLATTG